MNERHEIEGKCEHCGKNVTLKRLIRHRWPVHLDENGFVLGDGYCPELNKPISERAKKVLKDIAVLSRPGLKEHEGQMLSLIHI